MATHRTTFDKLQRERAKKAKAAAKRERRLERRTEAVETAPAEGSPDGGLGMLSAAELLEQIELTHQRFAAGTIDQEEFEAKKAELLARLPID
jgi:Short C-terminal domain